MTDPAPSYREVAKPTGGPEARNIGWDGAGDWMWAVVIPHSPSKRQPWPTYKPLARFQTKQDAEAYISLLTCVDDAAGACKYALAQADKWEYPGDPGASVAVSVLRALRVPYGRRMRQHSGPPKVTRWRPTTTPSAQSEGSS